MIITIEGPPSTLTVRRKDRVAGIWINDASIKVESAPSFYAVASTGPVGLILSQSEDQHYRITLPGTISTGAAAIGDVDPVLHRAAGARAADRPAQGSCESARASARRAAERSTHAWP